MCLYKLKSSKLCLAVILPGNVKKIKKIMKATTGKQKIQSAQPWACRVFHNICSVWFSYQQHQFYSQFLSICTAECNLALTEQTGIVHSPGYPIAYPPALDCEITIRVDPDNYIRIVFLDFSVNSVMNRRCSDYLQVNHSQKYSGRFRTGMSRTTYKVLQFFLVLWPQIKRNEVMFRFHTKYYWKVMYSNSQLEWFIIFYEIHDKIAICRTGRREILHPMHHFSVYFITKLCFPQDSQWILLLYSSTIKWLWNKPSPHICLDCRIENNRKISNFSSTESPLSLFYTP